MSDHLYQTCRDAGCGRLACMAYRDGYDDGFADGLATARDES